MHKNMSYVCGNAVYSLRTVLWSTARVVHHVHSPAVYKISAARLYTYLHTYCTQLTHSNFSIFVSVTSRLYTQSTVPTITTNYI